MAQTMSLIARLSAIDNGFVSKMQSASNAVDSLAGKIKSGFAFGVLTGMGQQAFSALTNGAKELISEIDSSNIAWKTFEGNLSMLGKSEGEIKSVRNTLQDFAQKTVYGASDMATTYSQLAAVGVKSCDKLVTGFGGLAAAAENPQQAMKTLSTQATQMAAKPTVAWQDFKLMLEQTPAGIAAVAKQMGMSTSDLVTAVQDGKVKTEDFFDAIVQVGNNDAFQKLATEAKSAGQAMDGLKETLSNKLAPAWDLLSQTAIGVIDKISGALSNIDVDKITNAIKKAIAGVQSFIGTIAGTGAFKALKNAFVDLGNAISHIFSALAKSGVFNMLAKAIGNIVKYISKAVSAVSKFISGLNPKVLTASLGAIGGLLVGFKAFNFLKSFNPFSIFRKNVESAASGAAEGVAKSSIKTKSSIAQIITAVGNMAKGIGSGIQSIFKGIGAMLKMANPMNFIAIGAAIGIVVASFALLATQSEGISQIMNALGGVFSTVCGAVGKLASVIIDALANALVTLAPLFPVIAQSLSMLSPLVLAIGKAFSMVASSIGSAVSMIVRAITPVIQIVKECITEIVETIGNTVAKIVEIIAPYIPVITDAFTQIATVISNAIQNIVSTLAPYIPCIQKMVEATSQAIQSICEAFTTLVEQIVPVIESVTDLVSQLGDSISQVFESVADTVESIGEAISGVIESIGDAISGVLDSIAGIFDSIGEAAKNAGTGFEKTAKGLKMISELSLGDLIESLGAVGKGMKTMSKYGDEIAKTGDGMKKVSSALKSITTYGTAAVSATSRLASAFTVTASAASQSGQQMVQGFSGVSQALLGIISVFSLVSAGAIMLSRSFISLLAPMAAFNGYSSVVVSAIMSIGVSAIVAAAGMSAFGARLGSAGAMVSMMASALKAVESRLNSIRGSAKSAESAMDGMEGAIKSLEREFESLGKTAKTAMNALIKAFNTAATQAISAGIRLGNGFTLGMQSGLNRAPAVAMMAVSSVSAVLGSGYWSAYNSGAYIGVGFANGMLSMLGTIRNAAAQMAAAADAAVRAKARIGSPSRVAKKLGQYWGEGYEIGLLDMVKDVWNAAQELVSIPTVNTPDLSLAYAGELSEEYDYYRNTKYVVEVPVMIDGKEVARTTAPYTQKELDRMQTRNARKQGIR